MATENSTIENIPIETNTVVSSIADSVDETDSSFGTILDIYNQELESMLEVEKTVTRSSQKTSRTLFGLLVIVFSVTSFCVSVTDLLCNYHFDNNIGCRWKLYNTTSV